MVFCRHQSPHLSQRYTQQNDPRRSNVDWPRRQDQSTNDSWHQGQIQSTDREQRIVVPTFDLYSKEVGTSSWPNRITKFAYEIRSSPKNSKALSNILCKTSEEKCQWYQIRSIWIIHHDRLDSMTQNNTMREIFIQYNSFLDVVKIVLVFGIMSNDKQ